MNKKVHFFQVLGDVRQYRNIEFVIPKNEIEEFRFRAKLSVFALKEKFINENYQTNITLFIPESLAEIDQNNEREIENLLNNNNLFIEKILQLPMANNINLSDCNLEIIPAKGFYIYQYNSSVQNIIYSIFIYLIQNVKEDENIYIDISSGQNIYNIALVEAVRRYLTYLQLKNILNNSQTGFSETNIIFYPPITKEIKPIKIEYYKISAKAFFSLPIKSFDDKNILTNNEPLFKFITNKFGATAELLDEFIDIKRRINTILGNLETAFNSILKNIPLAFYNSELISLDECIEILEKDFIKFLNEITKKELIPNNNIYIIDRPEINIIIISNIFFAFSLYKSFQQFKNKLSKIGTMEDIKTNFLDLYENQNLNLVTNKFFLERDLADIEDLCNSEEFKGEKLLKELKEQGGSSDIKRNFFAHSGFISDWTYVRKENNQIYLRWEPSQLNRIKDLINKN